MVFFMISSSWFRRLYIQKYGILPHRQSSNLAGTQTSYNLIHSITYLCNPSVFMAENLEWVGDLYEKTGPAGSVIIGLSEVNNYIFFFYQVGVRQLLFVCGCLFVFLSSPLWDGVTVWWAAMCNGQLHCG